MTGALYFAIGSLGGLGIVAGSAAVRRGRGFAIFLGVVLGIHTFSSVALLPSTIELAIPYAYLQATVYAYFLSWTLSAKRPRAMRFLVSIPASYFAASSLFALPWAIVAACGVPPPLPFLPFAIGAIGLFDSMVGFESEYVLELDRTPASQVGRERGVRRKRRGETFERALRIVQITDPHLGTFMSVARLERICRRAVEREPDLILLTGDLTTMDTRDDVEALTQALSPLRALRGRVFACHGNHDHESPAVYARALAACDVALLEDAEAIVETPSGPVQIMGADFSYRARRQRLDALAKKHPRREGHFRLWLLHDPGAFKHLPDGEADLVLSGHTHGGHVGFLRLGLPLTFVGMFGIPDHGLFGLGSNRMYVHRGTGHYGFPLRVGVPSEQSLIHVLR